MSVMVSFVLSFFPRGVLDGILGLIGSVSEDFPSYSYCACSRCGFGLFAFFFISFLFSASVFLGDSSISDEILSQMALLRCMSVLANGPIGESFTINPTFIGFQKPSSYWSVQFSSVSHWSIFLCFDWSPIYRTGSNY